MVGRAPKADRPRLRFPVTATRRRGSLVSGAPARWPRAATGGNPNVVAHENAPDWSQQLALEYLAPGRPGPLDQRGRGPKSGLTNRTVALGPWWVRNSIGNRWFSVGTSGHDHGRRIAGPTAFRARTSTAKQDGAGFGIHLRPQGGTDPTLAKGGSGSCCLVAAPWAVERLAAPQSSPLKSSPAVAAGQHLDLRPAWPHGSRPGGQRLWIQLCSDRRCPLLQVLNSFGLSTIGPTDGRCSFRPLQRLPGSSWPSAGEWPSASRSPAPAPGPTWP